MVCAAIAWLGGRCKVFTVGTPAGFYTYNLPVVAGKIVFGVSDTLQCLEMGAVETLIVWENLEACPALLMGMLRAQQQCAFLILPGL